MEPTSIKGSSIDKAAMAAHAAKDKAQDKIKQADFFTKIFGDYEFNRYFIISILLIIMPSLGGIAVSTGALLSVPQLSLLMFPMATLLALILAVQPMKLILRVTVLALIIDISVILFNIL